ncbi:Aste57867_11238 [Aphanomyces stellatus]|uniref:Aste57867_11238 protein n=1 Tax=Aphanomyces stellatus TaxID=120398 RepID=A0A485KT33_9STRA|nr:hypothetical protein As57867_011196 [Aphanomyces stellatus]VFT88104.1 Aste57867_11238 [Aphanomyces stellatus]
MSQFHPEVAFGAPAHYEEDLDPTRQQQQQQAQQPVSQEYFKVDKPSYVWSIIHKLKTPQLNKRQKMCFYVCAQCIQENVPWQDCLINLVKQNPSNGTLHIKNRHPSIWNDHVDAQNNIEKKEKVKLDDSAASRKRARPLDDAVAPKENGNGPQGSSSQHALPPKQYAEDISNADREKLELQRLDIQLRYEIEKQRLALERRRDERHEREFELNQRLMLARAREAEFNLKANRLRLKVDMAKMGVPMGDVNNALADEMSL